MANTAANVRVGVTGIIHVADTGTGLPADATAAPAAGFAELGYIGEDGLVQTIDTSTTVIRAWGGDAVRTIRSEHSVQYTFTMIETSAEVLKLYYSDPDATASLVKIANNQAERKEYVFDVKDGDKVIRLALPDGEVVETGDITYATEEAIGYEVTIEAYPDSTGVKVYKRIGSV